MGTTHALSQSKPKLVTKAPAVETPTKAVENKPIQRADGREVRKHTIYLATEVSRKLTAYCNQTGRNLSTVIADSVLRYIEVETKQEQRPEPQKLQEEKTQEEPQKNGEVQGVWGIAQKVASPLLSLTRQWLKELEMKGW